MTYTLQSFTGAEPSEDYDSRYKAKIHRYQALGEVPWAELGNKKG